MRIVSLTEYPDDCFGTETRFFRADTDDQLHKICNQILQKRLKSNLYNYLYTCHIILPEKPFLENIENLPEYVQVAFRHQVRLYEISLENYLRNKVLRELLEETKTDVTAAYRFLLEDNNSIEKLSIVTILDDYI